jgi:hypothetical protein
MNMVLTFRINDRAFLDKDGWGDLLPKDSEPEFYMEYLKLAIAVSEAREKVDRLYNAYILRRLRYSLKVEERKVRQKAGRALEKNKKGQALTNAEQQIDKP